MTLLPADAQRISYTKDALPTYELPEECAHPECTFPAFDAHHVVRRSYTQGTGPQTWILIDGQPMPNLVGLCRHHHHQVTNNQAKINWSEGKWHWADKAAEAWVDLGPLSPVPLTESAPPDAADAVGALSEREPDQEGALRADSRSTDSEGQDAFPDAGYGASPVIPASSEVCSGCGRKLPKPKAELEPTRPKATWSIKVPVDERENGYALLRDLVEQCQADLGREGEPPYYALVEVMYAFLTSAKEKVA